MGTLEMEASRAPALAVDTRALRHCLSQFSTGVTIVTADLAGQRVGVTANSFSSLSLEPPLVLWSIGRTSRAFDAFIRAKHFAVSILADDQVDISQRFSSKEIDKFATVPWRAGQNGSPIIERSAAYLECTTHELHEGGDHVLVIGRVTRFGVEDSRNVLIFSQGRYSVGLEHPLLQAGDEGQSTSEDTDSFGTLVFKSHLYWSHGFQDYRRSLGVSVAMARLLYVLSRHRELDFEGLERRANLTTREVEDEIANLIASKDVQRNVSGLLSLTAAGRDRAENMHQQVLAYERDSLAGIPASDLAATRRTLTKYVNRRDEVM